MKNLIIIGLLAIVGCTDDTYYPPKEKTPPVQAKTISWEFKNTGPGVMYSMTPFYDPVSGQLLDWIKTEKSAGGSFKYDVTEGSSKTIRLFGGKKKSDPDGPGYIVIKRYRDSFFQSDHQVNYNNPPEKDYIDFTIH